MPSPSVHRFFTVLLLTTGLLLSTQTLFAKKTEPEEAKAIRLIKEVMKLDENIISVRPSRVKQMSLEKYKIQWMPTITLAKDTDAAKEEELARKMVGFILKFQGGVRLQGVKGGILTFFEGEKRNPKIGNISYKVHGKKWPYAEVWINYNKPGKKGRASCCSGGKKIGTIKKNKFVAQ